MVVKAIRCKTQTHRYLIHCTFTLRRSDGRFEWEPLAGQTESDAQGVEHARAGPAVKLAETVFPGDPERKQPAWSPRSFGALNTSFNYACIETSENARDGQHLSRGPMVFLDGDDRVPFVVGVTNPDRLHFPGRHHGVFWFRRTIGNVVLDSFSQALGFGIGEFLARH